MEEPRSIIVIGASAGGVEALRTVVAGLSPDIDAAVFITLHTGAHKSDLPWLLARAGQLPASHPADDEEIRPGHIYVAPPDHHMLVERGRVKLTKGPRENWARPAIDPLFRSAARAYGARVIGIILTGGLNDGTAGLLEVKARGGIAVVQDPADSISTNMPLSAIANVSVDHVLTASSIGARLGGLVAAIHSVEAGRDLDHTPHVVQERRMTAEFTLDRPVAITCPDCGGALRESRLGALTQFRCHIGHVYTAEVMLAAQFLALERFVEQALRSLNERAEMCRLMAAKVDAGADGAPRGEVWRDAMQEALDQTKPLQDLLTRDWIHPDGAGGTAIAEGD